MTTRAAKWYEIPIVGDEAAEKARLAKLAQIEKNREARRIRAIAKLFPDELPSIIENLPEGHPDKKRLLGFYINKREEV